MALKMMVYTVLPAPSQEIKHNLGTMTPQATFWQNDFVVNASIKALDKDRVMVYNVSTAGTLVLSADVPPKSRSKSASSKENEGSRVSKAK